MAADEKFSLLRKILSALGLPQEASDDIVERITDWLSFKNEQSQAQGGQPAPIEYPYRIRDDFLSAAEISFYHVLNLAVADWAIVCPKIPLGDLFYVRTSDNSRFRIYTNKIDRKHVDFLLCRPKTMRPLVGIELDDQSHQRKDRQERDVLVDNVFKAANLPLIRLPVKYAYSVEQLTSLIQSTLNGIPMEPQVEVQDEAEIPKCPKCGTDMVLRTARSGANQGKQFWGCRNYPNCRGILNVP
jgi:very-short-patch-repair endonuclease